MAVPACSSSTPEAVAVPVYGISVEEPEASERETSDDDTSVPDNADAGPDKSDETSENPDEVPVPVYGMAPIREQE